MTQSLPSFVKKPLTPEQLEAWKQTIANVADASIARSDATCLAFLMEHSYDPKAALQAIQENEIWRNGLHLDDLSAKHVEPELRKGKFLLSGKDKEGRPILIFNAAKHMVGSDMVETLKLALFAIERAIASLEGSEQYSITIIENLTDFSKSENADMKMVKFFVDTVQTHYPQRIGKFFAVHAPWFYQLLFKVIKPWLSADLSSKINILSNAEGLAAHMEADQLPKFLDGSLDVTADSWVEEILAEDDTCTEYSICPVTAVRMGCKIDMAEMKAACVREGPLKKQGGYVKKFNKRYCMAWKGLLLYFKAATDETIEGFIDLRTATVENTSKHDFTVTTFDKVGIFSAKTREDRDAWVALLKEEAEKVKPTA